MLYYIKNNDDNKIMFCGKKSACLAWLVAGNNYLLASSFVLVDFAGNLYKNYTTKR